MTRRRASPTVGCRTGILLLALGLALIGQAMGQTSPAKNPLLDLSLDELMNLEVLEGAAKYPISLEDAPAVMDVITAEEIRELAPRDLSDLLAQLPSLVVQDDRIRMRLTVRGTSIPGDEMTRILVLVDGHVLREHWNGTSPLDALCGVAPSQIKRLEVVRGPGSVLFGSSALWATVNIVTQDGSDIRGARWQGSIDPVDRTMQWTASGGQRRGDSELVVHLGQLRSEGDRLTYRSAGGSYEGASDAAGSAAGRLRWMWRDRLSLSLAHVDRIDHVPHEWYQSIAARNENRFQERSSSAEIGYHLHPRSGHELKLSAFADAYRGRWFTVYSDELSREGRGVWMDDGADRNFGGEMTYVALVGDRLRGALGLRTRQVEVVQHSGQLTADESRWAGAGDAVPLDARTHHFTVVNGYVTAQVRATGRLQGFGGLNLSRAYGEQRLTPKLGMIADPGRGLRLRAMVGEGFRTPSIYERYYTDGFLYIANPNLSSETVRTTEVSLTRSLGDAEPLSGRVPPTLTLTGYRNELESLVATVEVPRSQTSYARSAGYADTLVQFANLGEVRTRGLELSAQHLSWGPWRGSAQIAWQHTHDAEEHDLPNSPALTGSCRLSRAWNVWLTALEARYLGQRMSYSGKELEAFVTLHLQVGWQPRGARSDVRLRVDNLLDTPGEVALYQPDFAPLETIPIDGRRLSVQVSTRL